MTLSWDPGNFPCPHPVPYCIGACAPKSTSSPPAIPDSQPSTPQRRMRFRRQGASEALGKPEAPHPLMTLLSSPAVLFSVESGPRVGHAPAFGAHLLGLCRAAWLLSALCQVVIPGARGENRAADGGISPRACPRRALPVGLAPPLASRGLQRGNKGEGGAGSPLVVRGLPGSFLGESFPLNCLLICEVGIGTPRGPCVLKWGLKWGQPRFWGGGR